MVIGHGESSNAPTKIPNSANKTIESGTLYFLEMHRGVEFFGN